GGACVIHLQRSLAVLPDYSRLAATFVYWVAPSGRLEGVGCQAPRAVPAYLEGHGPSRRSLRRGLVGGGHRPGSDGGAVVLVHGFPVGSARPGREKSGRGAEDSSGGRNPQDAVPGDRYPAGHDRL